MSTGILNTAPGSKLLDELIAAQRVLASKQAVLLARLVAVADATPVTEFAPFEISAALTWTRQAAAAQLDLATDVVCRLPDVHAALASGDIDLPKARVIRDAVAALDLALARRIVAVIVPLAPMLTTGQLQARLAKLVIEADPGAAARRREARVRKRRVVLEPTEDNCANLFGLDLPAEKALAAANRLTAMARAAKRAGDPRSVDQLRADAFLEALSGNTAGGGGGVELVAPLDTLVGLNENPGHLNGYGPVIADIVRQIAEQQRGRPWDFTVRDNESGEIYTGTTRVRPDTAPARNGQPRPTPPTSTSRSQFGSPTRRRPNAALARHIRSRDRTCRAPGCRRPASRADLDHTIAYEHGGRTTRGNLGALCRYHHRAKHEGLWVLNQVRPGVFVWYSPLGRHYVVMPEPP